MTESEYTPTVERLRDDYRRSRVWEAHNGGEIYWEEFERRLNEIQADAWDEGAKAIKSCLTTAVDGSIVWDWEAAEPHNPYRKEQDDE